MYTNGPTGEVKEKTIKIPRSVKTIATGMSHQFLLNNRYCKSSRHIYSFLILKNKIDLADLQ